MNLTKEVGSRIKAAREKAGITQTALAKRLCVTQTAVSSWESGRRLPHLSMILMICQHLDTPLSHLIPDPHEKKT